LEIGVIQTKIRDITLGKHLTTVWVLYEFIDVINMSKDILARVKSLLPSGLGGGDNVCRNIGNIFVRKTSSECWHGVLSVGDLVDDSLFVASTCKVLLKGILLESLLGHDHILSSSVACSAVSVEDSLSSTNITGESGGGGNTEGEGSSSGNLCGRESQLDIRIAGGRESKGFSILLK